MMVSRTMCSFRFRLTICWVAAALATGVLSRLADAAELKTVVFKTDFTDFAMNPETGDIAAIDAEGGTVVLIPEKLLSTGEGEPGEPVAIGPTPISICFKQLGDKSYFAIVCRRDSNLTLFNAADLSPAASIETTCTGISQVFCSPNPADPFVYLVHKGNDSTLCSAINIRDHSGPSHVFASVVEGATSPDGRLVYQWNPWSSNPMACLRLANSWTDSKPKFQFTRAEHQKSPTFLPDPTGSYLSSGNVLHSADLARSVASFKFTIVGFAMTPPLIIGTTTKEPAAEKEKEKDKGKDKKEKAKPEAAITTLHAASFNSFQPTGKSIPLPPQFRTVEKRRPENVSEPENLKGIQPKTRYLTDEKRERFVCCYLDKLVVVPLAEFKAPHEPLVHAALKSTDTAFVGTENEFQFEVADKSVHCEFTEIPDGAKVDGLTLQWSPVPDQVGPHLISLRLKTGDLARTQTFTLHVLNKSLTLPFEIQHIACNESGTVVACWNLMRKNGVPTLLQLATVDVAQQKILATKSLPLDIKAPVIDNQFVYLCEPNGRFIQVHDFATLNRVQTIYPENPIDTLYSFRDTILIAAGRPNPTLFNLPDLTRRKSPFNGRIDLLPIGPIWTDYVLDDKLEKPRLLLRLQNFLTIGESGRAARRPIVPYSLGEPRQIERIQPPPSLNQDTATFRSQDAQFRAVAYIRPGPVIANPPTTVMLAIQDWVRGTDIRKFPVAQKRIDLPKFNPQMSHPVVATCSRSIAVAWDSDLYHFQLPDPLPAEFVTGISIRPDHNHLALSEAKEGVLKLPHVATGGIGKKSFMLVFAPTGVSIDEATGTVTIQSKEVIEVATNHVVGSLLPTNQGNHPPSLDQYQRETNQSFVEALGREPHGIPVSLPIHLRVQDEGSQSSDLRYVIAVEAPLDAVKAKQQAQIVARDAELKEKMPPQPPAEHETASPSNLNEEVKALRRHVRSLEVRIEALTRQLEEVNTKLNSTTPEKK